jgi:hypothetical protein
MRKRRGVTSPLPDISNPAQRKKKRLNQTRTELQQYGLYSDILRERDVYDQLYGK